jgi:CelD/BcsL family acetyltransferase involved in cellulose biosynthesis
MRTAVSNAAAPRRLHWQADFISKAYQTSSVRSAWTTISAEDYYIAFERFGGSFAVHPRVVALVASLAKRPVRYAGFIRKGELVAAVPLWGTYIAATGLALSAHRQSHLIDVGDQELVLPVAENAYINMPFIADTISVLHAGNISNLKRVKSFTLMLAKGLQIGTCRHSRRSRSKRRREMRLLEEVGGKYYPITELPTSEVAAIYAHLFEKRWGFPPRGQDLLPTVLGELKDMLCGDVLLVGDRPAAIGLVYRNETSRWLFANLVNQAVDPEHRDYSVGSILMFRSLELLEHEANVGNKELRFSFGKSGKGKGKYKALWCVEMPAYGFDRPFYLKCSDAVSRWRPGFGSHLKAPPAMHRGGQSEQAQTGGVVRSVERTA